jgi:hypothetical protein
MLAYEIGILLVPTGSGLTGPGSRAAAASWGPDRGGGLTWDRWQWWPHVGWE